MSAITTHVLDTARGCPAAGVPIVLERQTDSGWQQLGSGDTDDDGRLRTLLPEDAPLDPGIYRISFDTETYFSKQDQESFYPEVQVTFRVRAAGEHYHVPLLLSPFGYSTYRGS